jgi:adenosylmethionine-8-amino-7-oxononanoate aminotransferase
MLSGHVKGMAGRSPLDTTATTICAASSHNAHRRQHAAQKELPFSTIAKYTRIPAVQLDSDFLNLTINSGLNNCNQMA